MSAKNVGKYAWNSLNILLKAMQDAMEMQNHKR